MYADIFKKRLSVHPRERFEDINLFDFYKKSNKFRAAFHSDCVLDPGT